MDRTDAEKFAEAAYAEGTMWGEAKGQRMDSWLECSDDELDWDNIMNDTDADTLYWLEEMMNDCDKEELAPGGLYYWMVTAYEEGS